MNKNIFLKTFFLIIVAVSFVSYLGNFLDDDSSGFPAFITANLSALLNLSVLSDRGARLRLDLDSHFIEICMSYLEMHEKSPPAPTHLAYSVPLRPGQRGGLVTYSSYLLSIRLSECKANCGGELNRVIRQLVFLQPTMPALGNSFY